jgi:response regulator RpfG family c-di-GMP phosphodiesterase
MTLQRLNTSLFAALRNYRDLLKIEKNRQGLEKIIKASANLFRHNSMHEFFTSILSQLSSFYQEDANIVYIRENEKGTHGFVTVNQSDSPTIVVATGKYKDFIGKTINEIDQLKEIYNWMRSHNSSIQEIKQLSSGIVIKKSGKNSLNNYIFIEGNEELYDTELINLFMTNYSIALDNFILNNMISETQNEIIITFGDVIEKHFDDTNTHVLRISNMMYEFALVNNFSYQESEMIKVASTMHDIGKIAIPDAILKKPGKLNRDEFEVIKTHTVIGHQILSKSKLDILKLASEIALYHHEKYDGTGYPELKSGKAIPIYARMMAIIDVFDAITHKRCYKDAQSEEEALEFLKTNRGSHFDPILIDVFLENYERITKGNL